MAAARATFADLGYDKASIRAIAAAARVDPALLYHYFSGKDQLFASAMELPIDPSTIVPEIVRGERRLIAERVIGAFLTAWDAPGEVNTLLILLRSAVTHEKSAAMLREFLVGALITRVLNELGTDEGEVALRASLAATQMIGLAMIRYVLKVPPLATAPASEVVAVIAPNLQRYLTGKLPPERH